MRRRRLPTALAVVCIVLAGCSNGSGGGTPAPTQNTPSSPTAPASQTITFNAIATQTVGTTLPLTATASSGLAVSFASTTAAVCTVSETTATLLAVGTCTIQASQAGNANYAAAPDVSQSFSVQAASASLPPTALVYSANPLVATVSSAIAADTPSNSGGAIASYSVAPALPAGLMLNTTTGVISGTPSAVSAAAIYTVTGSNSAGSTTASLSITVNFVVATPGDYGYPVPSPEPTLPASFDLFTPPLFTANAAAPAVAEWTRTAAPGNAISLAMAALTTDTSYVFYGQTGTALTPPLSVTPPVLDNTLQGTASGEIASLVLPTTTAGLSAGMYLAWPQNSVGFGAPVAINRTEAWWAGPLTAAVGDTVSIYGRDLTYPGTYPDTTSPKGAYPLVYLASTNGGSNYTPTVTAANPYKVDFSTANVAPGTYNLWIHNGAGGHFGWSEAQNFAPQVTPAQSGPATLTLNAASLWNCQASGPSTFNVMTGYGATGNGSTDDTAAVTAAIVAAGAYASNSSHPYATVYFPAGVYMVNVGFQPPSNLCFMGAGTANWQTQTNTTGTASILRLSQTTVSCGAYNSFTPPQNGQAFIWANAGGGGSNNVEFTQMVLDANGNLPCFNLSQSNAVFVYFQNSQNVKFDSIVLNATGVSTGNFSGSLPYPLVSLNISGDQNAYLHNSTIIGAGIQNIGSQQVFIDGNLFLETDDSAGVIENTSNTQTAFWNNTMEDLEKYNTDNPSAQIPYNAGSTSLYCASNLNSSVCGASQPALPPNPNGISVGLGPYGVGRIGGSGSYEAGQIYIGQNQNLNAGPCDPTNTSGTYPASYPGCNANTNQNAGEQVLFEMASTDYGGMATASTANSVTISGLTETSCGYTPYTNCIGEEAIIVGGTGLGQNRHIIAQNGGTVTVSAPWLVNPDATSRVYVANVAYQIAVYGNTEQGKADYFSRGVSLAGVEPWGNVYGLVYDSNQVSNVRIGMNDAALQESSRATDSWIVPNYFNLFMNNTVQGAIVGIRIDDSTYYNGFSGDPLAVSFVGDVYRNNVLGTANTSSPNTGIIRTGFEFTPCPIPSCTGAAGQEGDTIQGIIMDGNSFVINPYNLPSTALFNLGPNNTPAGLWTDAGNALVVDTLMNNNSFTLVPSAQSGYTGPSYGWAFGSDTSNPPVPTTATPGDTCFTTGTNIVTGFATTSTGLTCTQK